MSQRSHVEPLHYLTSNLQVPSHKPSQYFTSVAVAWVENCGQEREVTRVKLVADKTTDKTGFEA